MKVLSWKQCLAAAGKSEQWFRSVRRRDQMVLAWGKTQPTPNGIYCEVDSVALLLSAMLAAGLGPTRAAGVMRAHCDEWLAAVADAESTDTSDVMLIYSEVDRAGNYALGHMTVEDFARTVTSRRGGEPVQMPLRMTWLNVTAALREIRDNARRAGLDLSAPFLPARGDPRLEELIREQADWRERAIDLVRERRAGTGQTAAGSQARRSA